jgi:hypothetical protein
VRIISGGQTGVDRAAWDVARELRLPFGGWVPGGRTDEIGRIPALYGDLPEASVDPADRTRRNVEQSDATLVICRGRPIGGTATTVQACRALAKPHLVVDLAMESSAEAVARVAGWLADVQPAALNVAGPRASQDPGIYDLAAELLRGVLARHRGAPKVSSNT